jgi:hypothetical protein
VDVAVAYKDFGFTDEFWVIDYWYRVTPGKCKLVFSHFYAPNNLFSFQKFPLYLAFVFTDSTGVSGAAKVNPPRGTAPSRVNLCASPENYKYRVNGKTPEAPRCPKGAIPVSFVWEPVEGVYPNVYGREYPPPKRFTVALGPNDRAIPVGSQAQTVVVPSGPGTIKDFAVVLRGIMKRAGRASNWSACIEPTVVKTHAWKDTPAADVKSLEDAVLQFISTRKDRLRFRIVEKSGRFVVEEYKGEFCDPFYGVG